MRTVVNPRAIPEPAIDRYGRGAPPITKSIPFDYVFEFKLQGKSANNTQDVVKLQDVVEISMQGVFVGVSLGYSFVLDERKNPRAFGPVVDSATVPVVIPLFQSSGPLFTTSGSTASAAPPTLTQLQGAFVAGVPGDEVVIVDVTGGRVSPPQRVGVDGTVIFPTPDPLGVIRVWDRTNNLLSEPIDVVVQSSTPVIGPDASTRKLPAAGDKAVTVYGGPNDTVKLSLLDRASNLIQVDGNPHTLSLPLEGLTTGRATIPLNRLNNDRPLSAGDTLLVELASTSASPPPGITSSRFSVPQLTPSTLTLGAIAKGLQASNVSLSSGFRFSQRFVNFFAANTPFDQIDPAILGSAFEPACGPEDISFLYSIDVVSTGRELQNKPIHNIAGLGIANGDRPFRPFARPVAFEPRSVIRIQIEELSTLPGTLYIVLQGFKLLGSGRTPE